MHNQPPVINLESRVKIPYSPELFLFCPYFRASNSARSAAFQPNVTLMLPRQVASTGDGVYVHYSCGELDFPGVLRDPLREGAFKVITVNHFVCPAVCPVPDKVKQVT